MVKLTVVPVIPFALSEASEHRHVSSRLRLTIGLRKIDGAWKIAHEHHSFPLEL